MGVELLQSHYRNAQKLLRDGDIEAASREAELAVDEFWKSGDSRVVQALPLLSLLRHASDVDGDLFESLEDLPTSLSDRLLTEATLLQNQHQNDASAKMLADVSCFMTRWVGEVQKAVVDEKVTGLRSQIAQFYADGKRDLAVEASLELANEYALRGKGKRAFKLFKQVAEKSKRPGRTAVRINCLLDFGQFMSRSGKPADAERLLGIAAGVSRNARDKEKFAHVIATLGVVLMHQSKNEPARKHLEKARSMLSAWDVEADIVNHHLEALKEGTPCDCPEATSDLSFADADWD